MFACNAHSSQLTRHCIGLKVAPIFLRKIGGEAFFDKNESVIYFWGLQAKRSKIYAIKR